MFMSGMAMGGVVMSMELLVGLPAGATADGVKLSAQAKQLGFELSFNGPFSLDSADGFQPGKLAGFEAGIEVDIVGRDEIDEISELFGEQANKLEKVIAFYWGGSFVEGAFAFAVAAALVAACNGVCFDPQEDELLSLEQVRQEAEILLDEARRQPAG
ncbi:MAG: hypothetical protein DI537_00435 [Stutzerimonas stutzeri]|nr:MAG: hypothetical protein DI537_00435 [Stutzerimonas stutzeri]